ncbi:MAG: ribosome recycling factor, partial [Oscillospiraceae bacterium]|nr:ribosome recycling factor [Oscillospiraceae bacterium]
MLDILKEKIDASEKNMKKIVDRLQKEYGSIRAGRANPAVLDKIPVDYFGTPTPINQVAAVSVSEGRMLLISPWDPQMIK